MVLFLGCEILHTASILIILIVIGAVWLRRHRPVLKLPPGPPSIPIIGNLHQLKQPQFVFFDQLFQQFGKIFSFRLGQRQAVVVSSLEDLKTCLSNQSSSGRMKSFFMNSYVKNSGIIFIDGEKWKFHRRLALQIFRDFGMGKSTSEYIVRQEANELCQYLDHLCELNDNLIDTSSVFGCATMNVISHFALGERPGYVNKEYNEYMEWLHYVVSGVNRFVQLPVLFPFLNIFTPLYYFTKFMKWMWKGQHFTMRKVEKQKQYLTKMKSTEPSNFVEAYFTSKDQSEKKMRPEETKKLFNDWQICRLIFEFYGAGMDTSSTTLCWTILLLSLHDSVREKMTQEIHNIIGKEKIVSLEDKKHFQYALAVIDEIMRYSSVVPNAVTHRAMEDMKIGEYDIPKDTLIIPNIYSIHHDPDIWEKPNEFYPQHFLSDDGMTYRPREHLIPFGIGKRSCLGESLARIEVFIFIITLVQRYRFRVDFDEQNGENLSKSLLGSGGLVRATGSHKIFLSKQCS